MAKVDWVAGSDPAPVPRDTLNFTAEEEDDTDVASEDAAGDVNEDVVPLFTDKDDPELALLVRFGLSSPSKSASSPQPSSTAPKSSAENELKLLCLDDGFEAKVFWTRPPENEDDRDEESPPVDPEAGSVDEEPPVPTSFPTFEATAEDAHAVSDEAYPPEL